jgi:hypothetical protein
MPKEQPTEYHVVRVDKPDERWEVQWGKRRMGYQAWDKRVATSAAKEMAKQDRPSKVVIHSRAGEVEKEIPYEEKPAKKSRGSK